MKTPFFLLIAFILTGCSTSWDPPPTGYKSYKVYNTRINTERIKQDMTACGFPDVIETSEYFVHDISGYAQSALCMEKKGYKHVEGRRGVCSNNVFKDTETCQNHLREAQSKQNQR